MSMWMNLGMALGLLRELRGKSQSRVAKDAGIGKSQLSKYENGKELPKLDSLEKVLGALEVGHFEFFYTLYLVDRRAADLVPQVLGMGDPDASEPPENGVRKVPRVDMEGWLYRPPADGKSLLGDATDQAFARLFLDVLTLYRSLFEQTVLQGRQGRPRPRPRPGLKPRPTDVSPLAGAR